MPPHTAAVRDDGSVAWAWKVPSLPTPNLPTPPCPRSLQLKLPATGARLIIASDGLWDAMPAGRVARVLRGQPTAKAAANQAVSGVAASMGGLLRDDIIGKSLGQVDAWQLC